MKLRLVIALLACAGLSLAPSQGTGLGTKGPAIIPKASLASAPGASLPRSSPEAQGVSSAAILSFIEAADKSIDSLHSFMLLLYNTSATYMLAAIVEKTAGMSLLDYLRPRLFEPLGVENPTWEKSPEGITVGGYGLSIRTEDIARFGQLYLQKGNWLGKRLIPAAWVEEATSFQTSNGSNPRSD